MGDKRKNTGDGETPPAKGRPGLKPATVPIPVAVEAPQRPVTAPGPAAVEATPTPVAVETPVTASSLAAVEAAATPVAVETPAAASSAMVLAGGTVAAAATEGDVMTLLEFVVPKTVLHCNECHHPLKPPLYLCSLMRHVACGGCVGGGGGDDDDDSSGDDSGDDNDGNEGGGVTGPAGDDNEDGGVSGPAGDYKCSSCTDLAASLVYVKSPYLDTLFSNVKVSCPYKKYGCGGTLAFRDAAAHAAACGFAPCLCLECSFEGLPADLVRHLTEKSGQHGWATYKITYGKDHLYVFDELNKEPCQKLLVAEEDDGVFLLTLSEDCYFVNLLCVRNEAVAVPVYSSSVAVEGPPAKGLMLKLERKVVASCQGYYNYEALPVHPGFLHGEQTKKLHVCVCIRKTQSTSA